MIEPTECKRSFHIALISVMPPLKVVIHNRILVPKVPENGFGLATLPSGF
jgi:hypothetical protein